MAKPTVLTFSPFYLPCSSTGPVQTVSSLVSHLNREFDFRIFTSDRGRGEYQPYRNVEINTWNEVGPSKVYYASPQHLSLKEMAKIMNSISYDILYLNTFFHPDFAIKPLFLSKLGMVPVKPIILAPRGQFSRGALKLKAWKKYSYALMFRLLGLGGDLVWQASTEEERDDIRRVMGEEVSIITAKAPPSVKKVVSGDAWREKKAENLKVLFLSRITPMKNLDYAIDVLSGIKKSLDFIMVGPVAENRYWKKCKTDLQKLPDNINWGYKGAINHEEVLETMASHDLFFLPTAGENYGHVVQEALSAGTPVLISDQTPWRNLEEEGVGWALPLDQPDRFRDVIRNCTRKGPKEYRCWRKHIVEWEENRRRRDPVVEQNRKLFYEALFMKDGCTGDQIV